MQLKSGKEPRIITGCDWVYKTNEALVDTCGRYDYFFLGHDLKGIQMFMTDTGHAKVDGRIAFFSGETSAKQSQAEALLTITCQHVEAATKASLCSICIFNKLAPRSEATCQIFRQNQCGRMVGTKGSLSGLQSSSVERLCIFQQAHGFEATCQSVEWDQCGRMLDAEGALTGLQSSPAE